MKTTSPSTTAASTRRPPRPNLEHRPAAATPAAIAVLVALFAALGSTLLPAPASAEIVDRVVLRVNDRVATLVDYETRRNEALSELSGRQDLSSEQLAEIRENLGNQIFRKMFEDLLLLSRADQLAIHPDEREVDAAVGQLRQSFGIQTDDEFAAALSQQGMTLAELREDVRDQLRIRQVVTREVTAEIELEEDDLRRVYRSEADSYVAPRRWRARELIVLEAEDRDPEEVRKLAERIHDEAAEGRAIREIAAEYAEKGLTSDLVEHGWVGEGELAPALEAALESLSPGEISEPVEARGGYHIIELQEYEEERVLRFSEVAERIERAERQRLFAQEFEEYMRNLEESAYVVADPPPGAAGFRTVAGDREDVDPYATFEPVSEATGSEADATEEARPEQAPEVETEPSEEEGPPPP